MDLAPRRTIGDILSGCSFIVTGDAVCAFNPIYGQGMTVSALDAMTLERCFQEQQRSPRADFEQHFQHQIAKITACVWLLATNEDLRWPTVKLRGARPNPGLHILRNYLDLVLFSAIIGMGTRTHQTNIS
ncbi:MAG: hypothetical protein WA323_00635 [Candidatus Nitrosopolaris sp.]